MFYVFFIPISYFALILMLFVTIRNQRLLDIKIHFTTTIQFNETHYYNKTIIFQW